MITSNQAKQARGFCGLSQSRVVEHTGINRSYLSQFENGKILLPDSALSKLYGFYTEHGWRLNETEAEELKLPASGGLFSRPRFIEGIQIPENFNDSYAESLVEELLENNVLIKEILSGGTPTQSQMLGLGEDIADIDSINEDLTRAIHYMARNYCIVSELQGWDCILEAPSIESRSDAEEGSEVLPTIRDYLGLVYIDWDFQEFIRMNQTLNDDVNIETVT